MNKMTEWFSVKTPPKRDGVYAVRNRYGQGFRYWADGAWGPGDESPALAEMAAGEIGASWRMQNAPDIADYVTEWCGLAHKP